MKTAPIGGLLYSLLHLGGFDGDISFYGQRAHGNVLEMGCGDGRIAAALCLGSEPLSVLQQQQQQSAISSSKVPPEGAVHSPPTQYVGVENCEPLALKARARLDGAPCTAEVVIGDFLQPPPPERTACFDTVLVPANTLFCTRQHEDLLSNCAASLRPGGVLLLDVYNALLWHGAENDVGDAEGDDAGDGSGDDEGEEEEASLLVRVQDEDGIDWTVYEREPLVDSEEQRIVCAYDFHSASGGEDAAEEEKATSSGVAPAAVFQESVEHSYLLPEQLVRAIDAQGFAIDEIFGGFDAAAFDPDESEHVVVVARLGPSRVANEGGA